MVIREGRHRQVSRGASGQSSDSGLGLARTWHFIVARSSARHLMVPRSTAAEARTWRQAGSRAAC